jgi:cation diffusion facilitator CzcD-associated flavoprotein CzcO
MQRYRSPRVVIVGAGFGGLGLARSLRRAGLEDVTVLERAGEVGGVWRDNTYPGAACDVPSPLYSWSWAPNCSWSRRYSTQPEILDYLRRTAADEGLLDLVRTGTTVTAADWDPTSLCWHVRTDGPSYEADLLVFATGQLANPVVPAIPGAETFAGTAFHSAQWRHDIDLADRQVAVVGTGASAIQFVPGIVDRCAAITIFQRSAPYVVPKPDRSYSALHHRVFRRHPWTLGVERTLVYWLTERFNGALSGDSPVSRPFLAAVRAVWRLHLRRQVRDRTLRRRLRPDYPLGCKRVLFSNDWYRALDRDHVEVVTDAVAAIEPAGVRTRDGRLHPADVLVWGTGFAATDFLGGIEVTGVDGRRLADEWKDGARAHLGMAVAGFPNLFLLYGPNTNLGGSSIIGMLEAQAGYVTQVASAVADGRIRAVAPRREVYDGYDREMQQRLATTAWAGCSSWYTDGPRITTNWPGLVREYRDRTAEVDWSQLEELAGAGTGRGMNAIAAGQPEDV